MIRLGLDQRRKSKRPKIDIEAAREFETLPITRENPDEEDEEGEEEGDIAFERSKVNHSTNTLPERNNQDHKDGKG